MDAYNVIFKLTDDAIPYVLADRSDDAGSRYYNGQIMRDRGIAEPNHSAAAAALYMSAYFCKDSRWYGDETLLDAALVSLKYLNAACNEDGTLDLIETNFHDATMNGFTVGPIASLYRLLERETTGAAQAQTRRAKELETMALSKTFLETSVSAMLTGGFHTPNHRWVISAALAQCYRILGDERCLALARTYLSEGIDCNAEGDYTERSVGIYDVVNNNMLSTVAKELDMPELYEFIDRNLEKNWYYIEPDLTALTLASRRQDYGKESQMVSHFVTYYQAALRTGNGRFAWMAGILLEQIQKLRVNIGSPQEIGASLLHMHALLGFMLDGPGELPAAQPMPMRYERFFGLAGVARCRRERWTCSLLRDNSTFMKLQNGNLKVYFKLACTFFQFGKLVATDIAPIDGGCRVSCENEWGYTRPLAGVQQPDWWKIDRNSREKANWQKHRWDVDVLYRDNGITMRIRTEGTPNIPMKLEIILPPGGILTGNTPECGTSVDAPSAGGGMAVYGQPDGWAVIGGEASYDLGGEGIRVSGGFNEHIYAPNMRNSDPKPAGMFCLYCTGFTPLDKSIDIDMTTVALMI